MSEGNVQLKLQVGLDLAFLRKQLSGIGTSLAGQPLEIDVKFNRQAIASEYRLLNRYLSNKTFRISVETNLKAEIAYADTLQRKLKELSAQKVQNLAGTAATGRAGGFIDEGKFNAYLNRLTKAPLEAVRNALQSSGVQMKAAGKGTVEELRQSILSGLPQVTEDIAKGLTRGLNPKMQESGRKGARSAIDGFKDAAGIASPSKVFKQLGRFSAEGFGIGFFNEFSRFQSRATAQVRQFVGVLSLELARVQVGSIGAGRGILAGSPRGGGAHMAPIGPLPHGSQEPWAYNQQAFRYEPRLSQPGQMRGGNVPPMRERFPFAAAPSIMGTTSSPGMLGRGFPALPPAGGTSGAREASLALRELAAHGRSAARAASVFAEDAARAAQRSRLQTVSGQMPMGGGGRFLPPPGGRRSGPGGVPFGGFPSEGMMGGRQGPATFIGPGGAMAQWKAALKGAEEAMSGFQTNSIPFIGGLKSIAMELGQATKQVLLYGTAYKGLAFITSLPGQIFNAAKAQQQYNNSLKVVTESTGTYAKELLYVDQIQRTFGLDLQATRKGFTDLYASMAPTGFDSGSIEKLFTGISAASAALQLTPATMDRVIYAFAQMASKGQIMSEELKRQLGDALPGALGIFANAAGMSLQEFNKAMEAGEFTGNKFRETIAKVTDELIDRFGSGAQEAGKSLQGLTNVIKGDFVRTLEALAPLVNSVAQATLIPLGNALKQFASATSIAMGEMDRLGQQIEKQKQLIGELQVAGVDSDQIKKAEVALLALQSRYEALNIALEDPAVKQQAENIKVFVKQLQELGTIAMNVANGIGSVLTPIMTFFGLNLSQTVVLITSVVLGFNAMKLAIQVAAFTLSTFNKIVLASAAGEVKVKLLQMAFQTLGAKISIATLSAFKFGVVLKALIASTGIGAVVVALGLLAAGFASVGNSARKAAEDARTSIQSIKEAAAGGNVALIEMQATRAKVDIAGLDALSTELKAQGSMKAQGRGQRRVVEISEEQAARASVLGVDLKAGKIDEAALNRSIAAAQKSAQDRRRAADVAMAPAVARRTALGLEDPSVGVVPEEAVDDAEAAAKRAQSLESYYNLQDQLAKAQTQADIDYINALFDHRKNLINSVYDLEEARANSLQKEALAHQRAVSNIFLDLQKRQIDARLEVIKAEGSVARQMADGGTSVTGATGLLQGSTGISSGPHFDVRRQDGAYISPEQARALFDPAVRGQLTTTSTYGPRRAPVPGASTFHRGVDLAGPANTPLSLAEGFSMTGAGEKGGLGFTASIRGPQGEMYDVGHLQRPAAGAGAPRQVPGSERRDELAAQQAAIAKQKEGLEITRAQAEAQRALVVETERYLEQIFGIAENQLQTGILAKKTALLRAGATEQEIEDAMALDGLNLKYAAGVEAANNQIAFNTRLKEENLISQEELNKRNAYQNFLIKNLNEELPKATKAQLALNEAAKEYKFTGLITALQDEIKLLLVTNDVERERLRIRQEFSNLTPEQQLQIINLEEIKKKIQDVRAMIDDLVSSTVSDYKGFFKSVLFGEDPVEALKEFQKRLADKTLTLFLDFAMAPVEQFFKENLFNLFKPEESKEVAAATSNTSALDKNTAAIEANTAAQGGQAPTSAMANVPGVGNTPTSSLFSMGGLGSQAVNAPMAIDIAAFGGASSAIDSLNESVYSMGDAIPSFKDSLGNITDTVYKASEETNAQGATFSENLGKAVGAIGIAATSVMGIAAGIGQIKEGGASNVLGGIGSVLLGIGGAMGGFGKLFPGKAAANGAVWQGGFTAFANGGVVNGPTLGLVGEGKYNEAIVPLPDGRSIPVKMAGSSSRDLINNQSSSQSSSPVLSMSFETTRFGDVDYVNVEQLQRAMEETRRVAVRDGASRGASTALDRLQNSPAARRKIGLR
jgi:tape measure domain-containing protein